MPDQNHSRRRSKLRGFIIAEITALGILLLAGTIVLLVHPLDSTVITALNGLMFAAACGVATIPIFYFALAPILPRGER